MSDGLRGSLIMIFGLAGLFLILWLCSLPRRFRAARMKRRGILGTALVRNVIDLHYRGKGQPMVRYEVILTPSDGVAYDATKDVFVSPLDFPLGNIGRTFPVTIDPNNPTYFEFKHGSAAS